MRNIKGFIKFILKLSLIVAVAFGIYWALFWFLWIYKDGPRVYDQSYQHALLLQYNALEDEKRDNELIVFGASYVPFGIDVGARQTYDAMYGHELVPIVQPFIKLGGAKLGIDVGPMLKDAMRKKNGNSNGFNPIPQPIKALPPVAPRR